MKKNIYKVLAASFALSLIMTSPVASITSHAAEDGLGFNGEDAVQENQDKGAMPDDAWSKWDNVSSDNNSSNNSSNDSYTDSGSSNSGSDNGYVDSGSDNNYVDNSHTDSGSSNSYTDNSYTDNSYTDNSYTDNSYTESVTESATVPAQTEEVTAVEAETTVTVTEEPKDVPRVDTKKSETKKTDTKKSEVKKTETVMNVTDKEGKLTYGRYTYVISRTRAVCSVYYDEKYMASVTVIDSKGKLVEIQSIMIQKGTNGSLNMEINVDEDVEAAKIIITKAIKESDYSIEKSVGVRTLTINGVKLPIAIKKVQPSRANIK